jgi:hypothetical protein
MNYEHPNQKTFYNCTVQLFDKENKLLGTSFYNTYRPHPNFLDGFVIVNENNNERITQNTINNLSSVRYVITENKTYIK